MSKLELTPSARQQFALISDVLIPRALGMPAASDVDIAGSMLDHVLKLRDDLVTDFMRAVSFENVDDAATAERAAVVMNERDPKALTALGLVASAIYYMHLDVRKLLGYPGQESRPVLPDDEDDWQTDTLLNPVIKRGAIFRQV